MNIQSKINNKTVHEFFGDINNVTVLITFKKDKKIKLNFNMFGNISDEIIHVDLLRVAKNFETEKTDIDIENFFIRNKENLKLILQTINKDIKIFEFL